MTAPKHGDSLSADGTSLQGYVTASYSELCALFGTPSHDVDGYKVSTEWRLRLDSGHVATIYDYKETSLYDSSLPLPAELRQRSEVEWHIGGHSRAAATIISAYVEVARKRAGRRLADAAPEMRALLCRTLALLQDPNADGYLDVAQLEAAISALLARTGGVP